MSEALEREKKELLEKLEELLQLEKETASLVLPPGFVVQKFMM